MYISVLLTNSTFSNTAFQRKIREVVESYDRGTPSEEALQVAMSFYMGFSCEVDNILDAVVDSCGTGLSDENVPIYENVIEKLEDVRSEAYKNIKDIGKKWNFRFCPLPKPQRSQKSGWILLFTEVWRILDLAEQTRNEDKDENLLMMNAAFWLGWLNAIRNVRTLFPTMPDWIWADKDELYEMYGTIYLSEVLWRENFSDKKLPA